MAYARFRNTNGSLSLSVGAIGPACASGNFRDGGNRIQLIVSINGNRVGTVTDAQLTDFRYTSGNVPVGAAIGRPVTMADGVVPSSCWGGTHVHVEPRNDKAYGCYFRGQLNTRVTAANPLGIIGGEYAHGINVVCPAGAQAGGGIADGQFVSVRSRKVPAVGWAIVAILSVVAVILRLWPIAIVLIAAAGVGQYVYGKPRRLEKARRLLATHDALEAQQRVALEAADLGPDGFEAVRGRLAELYDEYTVEIPKRVARALAEFDRTARQRQLRHYLERQYVDQASISGVGPGLKRRLAAYGINTAADVDKDQIMEMPGFGPAKTGAVLAWRESRERKFQYNQHDPATMREREQSIAAHEQRRRAIENALGKGRDELQRRSQLPAATRAAMEQKLTLAARQVAQATADLSLLEPKRQLTT